MKGKLRHAACAVALAMTPALLLAAEANFEKTIPVSGSLTASVSTGSGFIHIVPSQSNEVHVVGHVHASHGFMSNGSDADVKEVAANPPIEASGSTLKIGNKNDGAYRHVSIDYEISAPYSSQWKVFTGSGDIKASGILINKLETGSGEVEANNVTGDASLQTGSGDIKVAFAKSGMVTAGTGSGSIHLENVQGKLKAETGSGDIDISGKPRDEWKLETGSGSIKLNVGTAPLTLDAESGSGSITTAQGLTTHGSTDKHHISGDINGGGPMVKVETGSGDIKIE